LEFGRLGRRCRRSEFLAPCGRKAPLAAVYWADTYFLLSEAQFGIVFGVFLLDVFLPPFLPVPSIAM
jgi:hypothetical protein